MTDAGSGPVERPATAPPRAVEQRETHHPWGSLRSRVGPILLCYVAHSLSGDLGLRTSGLNSLHVLALSVAFLVSNLERPLALWKPRGIVGLALASLTLGVALSWDAPERLALLPIFVVGCGLAATSKRDERREAPFVVLALAGLCYFLLFLLSRHPLVSRVLIDGSMAVSLGAGPLVGGAVILGPTYLGVPTLLFFLSLFLIALLFTAGPRRDVYLALGAAVLLLMFAVWLRVPSVYPVVYGTVFGEVLRRRTAVDTPSRTAAPRRSRFVPVLVAVVLALLLGTGGALRTKSGRPQPGRVVVYADACLRWDAHRGWDGAGIGEGEEACPAYDLLSRYLEDRGHSFVLRSSPISPADLASARILMLIDPLHQLAGAEREAIRAFVDGGGSLLVVGDHTDVYGSSTALNAVLEPFGIQLNFDTTYPFGPRRSWDGAMSSWPIPFARATDAKRTGIRNGASLSLRDSAIPIVIGTRSFSDRGDRRNEARGNLGNLRPDPGEQLGDAVLAALAFLGRGKVLVFGDTTPFQNATLARSHGFVSGVFDYLSAPGGVPDLVRNPILPSLLLGLVFLVPPVVRRGPGLPTALLCCLAAGCMALVATPRAGTEGVTAPASEVASIDVSHGALSEPAGGGNDGLGCLLEWLASEGLLPVLSDESLTTQVERSRVLFLMAPELPAGRSERVSLRPFMERGGLLVLSAGGDCGTGAESLLREFDYEVENRPLGNAAGAIATWTTAPVTFSSAWPVHSVGGEDEILCSAGEYPLVRFRPVGRGGLVVIGDCGYLLNRNLRDRRLPARCRAESELPAFVRQLLARSPSTWGEE